MTIFGHRNGFEGYRIYTGVPGGYRNPPEAIGPHGPNWWKRRGGQGAAAHPSPQVRIGQGGGRRPPLSFPPLSLSLSSPTPTWKGGVLLPVGVGLIMGRAKGGRPPPPPPLLYIQGGRHPLETQQLIIDLLAVCGAPLHHNPPRSYRSSA